MRLYFILSFLISIIWLGCTKSEKSQVSAPDEDSTAWTTTDLTSPELFTSGIEGPAVGADGIIYAVNFDGQGTIGQITPDGEASLFVSLPDSSIGNGIRFTSDGHMLIADYTRHNVLAVDMTDRSVGVWAHQPDMNQPNDLAITSDDIVFAGDPGLKGKSIRLYTRKTVR